MSYLTILSKFIRSKFSSLQWVLFSFLKLCISFFLVFFIVELLEISLWHDKNDLYNSHGFRDKEYSYKKPNNIFRILVLGDSQTSGQGIENLNDTWHKKLEVLMNKNFKQPKFEIISLAGQGWNTDTQLYELFKKGFKYNPNLILIGFNHNDVPAPYSSNCEYRDIRFFPHVKPIGQLREFSKVYQLAEFRLNRLLEKIEQKPEYTDCINRRFESRGWDMEKVYLDTILMAAQIKNIHIMLTTLPLLSKLGDNYPLKKAHLKIKNYCSDREIICSDLYDEGFKGLNPTPLKVSKTDWHFNEDGSEIIAQTLFKKLKALKTYDHLSKFSSAFDLKDLLNQKTLITKLDKKFSDFKRQSPNFRINFKNEQLFVKTQSKRLEYTHIISNTLNHKIIKVILDPNGNFKESKITLQKNSDPKVYFYNNKRQNKRHYLIRRIKTKQGDILNENKKIFLGDYVATRFISKIQLFPNMDFMDPKNLEIAFSENTRPKNQLSSQEIFNAISKFVKLNPDLFFDFLNKGYLVKRNFNQLSKLEQTIMYKEMEWTKYLITLYKLRHISYINTLISDILDNNPVPVLLRSIERFYFLNQRFKDLNNLYQSNSTLPRRFKLPTSQQIV